MFNIVYQNPQRCINKTLDNTITWVHIQKNRTKTVCHNKTNKCDKTT